MSGRFQFVLSKQPTPATLYLLKRFKWAENEDIGKLEQVEVCPKAMELTQEIAKRIGSDGGGALIIDYGQNGIVSDSLQVSCNTKSSFPTSLVLGSQIHLLLPCFIFIESWNSGWTKKLVENV